MSALDRWIGQTISFAIEDGATTWPKVYETTKSHPEALPSHRLAVPSSMIPPDLLSYLHVSPRFNTVTLSSRNAPPVSTPYQTDEEIDRLVRLLARLDAQNRSRDQLFHGRRLTVEAQVIRFEDSRPFKAQGPEVKLVLTGVTVHI